MNPMEFLVIFPDLIALMAQQESSRRTREYLDTHPPLRVEWPKAKLVQYTIHDCASNNGAHRREAIMAPSNLTNSFVKAMKDFFGIDASTAIAEFKSLEDQDKADLDCALRAEGYQYDKPASIIAANLKPQSGYCS